MCKCDPNVKTPYCGKPGCEWPQGVQQPVVVGMDFGGAIRALKAGRCVARAGWNGKGMWLALSGVDGPRDVAYHNFWARPNAQYASQQPGGTAKVLPCITMKTATGEILMGWLASQTDMLAEDWVEVNHA